MAGGTEGNNGGAQSLAVCIIRIRRVVCVLSRASRAHLEQRKRHRKGEVVHRQLLGLPDFGRVDDDPRRPPFPPVAAAAVVARRRDARLRLAVGLERREPRQAHRVDEVAAVVEHAHVDAQRPHRPPGQHAQRLHVDGARLLDGALDDPRELHGALAVRLAGRRVGRRRGGRRGVHVEAQAALAAAVRVGGVDLGVDGGEHARASELHGRAAVVQRELSLSLSSSLSSWE